MPTYSDIARIKARTPQFQASADDTLIGYYQAYIDKKIDNTIRSVLGRYDHNGFYIKLPLSTTVTTTTVDIPQMQVELLMDSEIQMAADDCVISKFRQDTSENIDAVEKAEERLTEIIYTKFGGASSIDQDFSTDYLMTFKLKSFNNGYIQTFDGRVILAFTSIPPQIINNTNNPDSRVIYLPASQFY